MPSLLILQAYDYTPFFQTLALNVNRLYEVEQERSEGKDRCYRRRHLDIPTSILVLTYLLGYLDVRLQIVWTQWWMIYPAFLLSEHNLSRVCSSYHHKVDSKTIQRPLQLLMPGIQQLGRSNEHTWNFLWGAIERTSPFCIECDSSPPVMIISLNTIIKNILNWEMLVARFLILTLSLHDKFGFWLVIFKIISDRTE